MKSVKISGLLAWAILEVMETAMMKKRTWLRPFSDAKTTRLDCMRMLDDYRLSFLQSSIYIL